MNLEDIVSKYIQENKTFYIKKSVFLKLTRIIIDSYIRGKEIQAFMIGNRKKATKIIIPNQKGHNASVLSSGKDLYHAFSKLRSNEYIIGWFHTHVSIQPYPSQIDIDNLDNILVYSPLEVYKNGNFVTWKKSINQLPNRSITIKKTYMLIGSYLNEKDHYDIRITSFLAINAWINGITVYSRPYISKANIEIIK